MEFMEFDTEQIEQYTKEAREKWGKTAEYRAFEAKRLSKEQQQNAAAGLMALFKDFAKGKDGAPEEAGEQVKKLKDYISAHFYPCSNEVLAGLGKLYASGGEFTANIDAYAGDGTAAFAAKAIEAYLTAHN